VTCEETSEGDVALVLSDESRRVAALRWLSRYTAHVQRCSGSVDQALAQRLACALPAATSHPSPGARPSTRSGRTWMGSGFSAFS